MLSAAVFPSPRTADAAPVARTPITFPAQRDHGAAGHEGSEGLLLRPDARPDGAPSPACPRQAPQRRYDIAAIDVDITYNRYGDHDPRGRMYVLQSRLAAVRAEEKRHTVTPGLQGDAIQPLTLRVRPGECLVVALRDDLAGKPATFHVHGAGLRVASSGVAATALEPTAVAQPGQTVTYAWWVRPTEAEGTHYAHSHGDERDQTSHGLFAAIVVEPRGATWTDPRTGAADTTGWDAVVHRPDGTTFREFTLYYHEVGDENYQLLAADGSLVPLVDPLLAAYKPSGRALDYRSEPFYHRMALQQRTTGRFDESAAYSSYAFGDPATPLLRSYLGEPVKERVLHAGSEVFHVHHVHGGAVRWRRQPGEAPPQRTGLDKHPPLLPGPSERTDSQTIGPSETFDVENECGSGGCQQSVGDFLYHCHVAHHYFAGMWGLWRVYNTRQDGAASTDALPPFAPLVDVPVAVTSDVLGLAPAAVRALLPPQGVPGRYDAGVWDWRFEGTRAVGEPDAGTRPALLFDPRTRLPAYPFLRPHLGARPPFAPGHGPAPYLDPGDTRGPASTCPAGTKRRSLDIEAVPVALTLSRHDDLVDPDGELFVLRRDVPGVLRDPALRRPLAVRANAGEDCVDVTLTSRLLDTPANHGFSKVNLHVHFVQFDVQASDGVVAGFNYEQSVRPFTAAGVRLTGRALPGSTTLAVSGARFHPGESVGVGLDRADGFEVVRVVTASATSLTIDPPLRDAHAAREIVSAEFVRYRWYPDVQFGTAYFHDHVDALHSWRHGLFGAIVAEPPGSTYHDPVTGDEIDSGPIADVHTTARVSVDVTGSFRELVCFIQDENPVTHLGASTGTSLNLRVAPLAGRASAGPATVFSTTVDGDVDTPVLTAYVGDPVVIRALAAATNEVHTLHVDGHWFRIEPWSRGSPPVSTARVGISERFDLVLPAAGGPQRRAGDYLVYNGRPLALREGSWGLLRVRDGPGDVRPLPGRPPQRSATGSVCPRDAPVRHFDVSAVDIALPMLNGARGKAYVLGAGTGPVTPLVLRATVGDCITVTLANHTAGGPVTFHADLLAADPADSGGVAAGTDPDRSVPPGGQRRYTYYASPEVGETVALVRDFGDVAVNPGLGLYGAVVVAARGARVDTGWSGVVTPRHGTAYRDVVLFFQDDDGAIGTHRMPYRHAVNGVVGLNYTTAVLAPPALVVVDVGQEVRLHVLAPWSQQAQVFSVEGHDWPVEPGTPGTTRASSVAIGGLEAVTLRLTAGGPDRLPGRYRYGDHRGPYAEAGLWGVLRVVPRVPAHGRSRAGVTAVAAAVVLVAAAFGWRARRRPS